MQPQEITIKNIEGAPETKATIILQNSINFIPKVSVILPVYNTEKYLKDCLNSIINQTLIAKIMICIFVKNNIQKLSLNL